MFLFLCLYLSLCLSKDGLAGWLSAGWLAGWLGEGGGGRGLFSTLGSPEAHYEQVPCRL